MVAMIASVAVMAATIPKVKLIVLSAESDRGSRGAILRRAGT